MAPNFLVLAIPGFFLLMTIEVVVMRIQRKDYYRLGDAINSTSLGIMDQVIAALVGLGPGMALYAFAARVAPFQLSAQSAWTWAFAMLFGDFIYYWWHRCSHRINFMWAGHVIHHQSEEYNLSTALRQSWITQMTAAVFFLPMAMLGVPFQVYLGSLSLNLLYQFWIHTRVIKKMGAFEWVFNTPSHHRVHHGVNPEYLDKNYAGILIVWDRIFRTFVEEEAEVVYGTVKPIQTWNPIRNNLDYWLELVRRSINERRGLIARIHHWFVPPEWTYKDPHPKMILREYRPTGYKKYDVKLSKNQKYFVALYFAVLLVCVAVFLNFQHEFSLGFRVVFVALTIAGLTAITVVGKKPAQGF